MGSEMCIRDRYLYACAVENPEIPGFCVSKSRGLRTDHRVKKIETMLFCYADKVDDSYLKSKEIFVGRTVCGLHSFCHIIFQNRNLREI